MQRLYPRIKNKRMNIIEPIVIGFGQLRLHKLRAMLSILGILISVGSVTGIVSMGDGLRLTVLQQFDQMGGTSLIWVNTPEQYIREGRRYTRRDWEEYLTNRDAEYFENEIEHIRSVVPIIGLSQEARYRNASTYASIWASNQYFHQTRNWKIERGRTINEDDLRNASKVVVIDPKLAEDLYGDEEPVGKEMKIGGMRFTVVGVFAEMRFFGVTNERNIVGPITTTQQRFTGNDRVNAIIVMAESPEYVDEVAQRIRYVLRRSHDHGEEFRIRTGKNEIEQFTNIVTILKIVAGGIAGISLIVGVIGIMNIMLVSVNERTREIGIRKALGAKRRSILWQFLLESMVLCLFGGALGVLLGIGIGKGISVYIKSITDLPFESILTPWLMMFAIMYSAGIGLFFGVYPAYRASKMDPVEALRFE